MKNMEKIIGDILFSSSKRALPIDFVKALRDEGFIHRNEIKYPEHKYCSFHKTNGRHLPDSLGNTCDNCIGLYGFNEAIDLIKEING